MNIDKASFYPKRNTRNLTNDTSADIRFVLKTQVMLLLRLKARNTTKP